MLRIHYFVFNLFMVNTYILWDETGEAAIIDPGCHDKDEQQSLESFIAENRLTPTLCINTHAHIDHILGNNFIFRKYALRPRMHRDGLQLLQNAPAFGRIYGMKVNEIVEPDSWIGEGDILSFGQCSMEALYTPGHAAGSISLLDKTAKIVLTGDVLFHESIGRTDLPTGDFDILAGSIQNQLYSLGDDIVVYPGHGHETTIGHEKYFNPFIRADYPPLT